jgi:hypothetical protein
VPIMSLNSVEAKLVLVAVAKYIIEINYSKLTALHLI